MQVNPQIPSDALDELARQLGIEERYRDALGHERETSQATKRALLGAMGVPAADEEAIREFLREREAAVWSRALPPTRVSRSKRGITLDVVVPAGSVSLRWWIQLEHGGERAGKAVCTNETRLGTRESGGRSMEQHRLTLIGEIPDGYHELRTDIDDSVCRLISTPERCWLPEAIEQGRRLWGVCAQLYLLRSRRNWGIGDFTDLRSLVEMVGQLGGDAIGLNPLHAMFLDNPEHASPYSPESRLLLNVLYIDVEAVPELADCPEARHLIASEEFQKLLEHCRAANLVDYSGVSSLKLQVLEILFDHAHSTPHSNRWKEFDSFREHAGESFARACVFEALRQHFSEEDRADWHSWPAEYRDASSDAVLRFAEQNADSVTFHAWMQWIADRQLEAAAEAAGTMRIGLYRDLAVGTDAGGSEPWSNPSAVVSGAHAGAPPDQFNAGGQDWGLPPFDPRVLDETGYQSFIEVVRANMRHAGALRIDHVMALQHLYWVPKGCPPSEGAYIQQPIDDLIGILALESHRNRCLIVGEDLGTVPDGFRERMMAANILSYRVLFFEQDTNTGAFLPPKSYPPLAVAVAGSHDLPTIRGWWKEVDVDIQERLHLFPEATGPAQARGRRKWDRRELVRALREQSLLPATGSVRLNALADAVHAYLARTTAQITMAQLDDITAETDPVNVPATSTEHPNWRRRLARTLEELPRRSRLEKTAAIFHAERGTAQSAAGTDVLR